MTDGKGQKIFAFCLLLFMNYHRRKSSVVQIGNTPMGGENPIRIQSMTNTSTLDTEGSVQQTIRIVEAGGEYVRLTAQGVREAENLKNIEDELHALGYFTPLVADIHFNLRAAESAARIVEKVRINPGNFADPVKTFQTFEYSDEEYQQELKKIEERFIPFLNICKECNTAIRIGVNHGSLSDRIMSHYGDSPQGMVESCMEFLRICVRENFHNVVISIKASNTFVMVRTVRLLVEQMNQEGMQFPLHLGVTEAGDGEDGRIKSALGIGALLVEGIGDTIRVSLSEDPELEIPVARLLVDYVNEKANLPAIHQEISPLYNPYNPERRKTIPIGIIGGENVPVVISDRSRTTDFSMDSELIPDFIYTGNELIEQLTRKKLPFLFLDYSDLSDEMLNHLKNNPQIVIINQSSNVYAQKALIHKMLIAEITNPLIWSQIYDESDLESFQIKTATDSGSFFLDSLADGILLQNKNTTISPQLIDACSFGILQAAGRRISKTEYISCPSCGRTLFDLQTAIKKVKAATSHLKGLKIAIMGCIVNGPGEMADADYGYVGAGAGKVSLYKGKNCVLKNISEENAIDELLKLIDSSH
jgi:(E)-4-hydroxy-3-methylbut-2-enyl-diphosphate synthase